MAIVCIPFRGCSMGHPWPNNWRGGIRNTPNTGFFIWQLKPSGKFINPYSGKCAGLNRNSHHRLIYWNAWFLLKNWEVWSCLGSCVPGVDFEVSKDLCVIPFWGSPVLVSSFSLPFMSKVSSQLLLKYSVYLPAAIQATDSPSETVAPNKLLYKFPWSWYHITAIEK